MAEGVALATAPPRRPPPLLPAALRPEVLAGVLVRRVGVTALERRVVVERLEARRLVELAGRALLTGAVLATGVAVTGLTAPADAAAAAVLLVAGVAGVELAAAGVLELAMAGRRRRETVELDRTGNSVSHRAPRNR
jgi:hypothetical protein